MRLNGCHSDFIATPFSPKDVSFSFHISFSSLYLFIPFSFLSQSQIVPKNVPSRSLRLDARDDDLMNLFVAHHVHYILLLDSLS